MDKTIEALKKNFTGIRTGRANPGLLDSVHVDVYGQSMPMNQVASVNVMDAKTLSISPFDSSNLQAIEKGISAPNNEKSREINLVILKILSMVNEPKKIPLKTIKTHSARLFFLSISNMKL